MINMKSIRVGDKVHYGPPYKEKEDFENGIVKEVPTENNHVPEGKVRVVYNCGGNWDKYHDYTSALTDSADLFHGWINWIN